MTVALSPEVDDLESYRREPTAYCYRMLGSGFDAVDRGNAAVEQLGDFGRLPAQHLTEDQHRALFGRKVALSRTSASSAGSASSGNTPLHVFEVTDDRVSGIHSFLDTERVFPAFGLPAHL